LILSIESQSTGESSGSYGIGLKRERRIKPRRKLLVVLHASRYRMDIVLASIESSAETPPPAAGAKHLQSDSSSCNKTYIMVMLFFAHVETTHG